MELDTESLTDKQFWLAGWCAVKGHPRILVGSAEDRVAANLEKLGWGTVEDGASVERIFRLSQDGEDAFAWLGELRGIPTALPAARPHDAVSWGGAQGPPNNTSPTYRPSGQTAPTPPAR